MRPMVVIFGPGAVGKMSVGESLSKQTGFPLLHNHISIEFLLRFFPFGSESFSRLDTLIRMEMIAEFARSGAPGLTFTFVWALERDSERHYIESLASQFNPDPEQVLFVELFASQELRKERNRTEKRLREKPSKRDLELSEKRLTEMDERFVLNTSEELPFFYPERHLKIDNTHLDPQIVAAQICRHFGLAGPHSQGK